MPASKPPCPRDPRRSGDGVEPRLACLASEELLRGEPARRQRAAGSFFMMTWRPSRTTT